MEFSDCPEEEIGSDFADVVTQMAQDLTLSGEYHSRLTKLAKWLVESALVPLRYFLERCEEEFLWDSEMIKIKAQDLKSKEPSWVTDEEFGMGFLEIKQVSAPVPKTSGLNSVSVKHGMGQSSTQGELSGGRNGAAGTSQSEYGKSVKEPRTRPAVGRTESTVVKSDTGTVRSIENQRLPEDLTKKASEVVAKQCARVLGESEGRSVVRRSTASTSLSKQSKPDSAKDDGKSVKPVSIPVASGDRDLSADSLEGKPSGSATISGNSYIVSASNKVNQSMKTPELIGGLRADVTNPILADSKLSTGKDEPFEASDTIKSSRSAYSPRVDSTAPKSGDKPHKRASPDEEADRLNKRGKTESDPRDMDCVDLRVSERERSSDARSTEKLLPGETDGLGMDELISSRVITDRSKDKASERHHRDNRERLERIDKVRGDDIRDRPIEKYGRERSVDRIQERTATDRNFDRLAKEERNKDDRSKSRYSETSSEKSYLEERFHGQSLPPPPPLPANVFPQSLNASRQDDDGDRRFGTQAWPETFSKA